MDVERFDDLGHTLLARLDARLTPATRELAREFLDAGEWALFVAELSAELTLDRTPVDATERDLLRELLHSLERSPSIGQDHTMIGGRDEVLASLNLVDPAHGLPG